jgi:hypothetical protein
MAEKQAFPRQAVGLLVVLMICQSPVYRTYSYGHPIRNPQTIGCPAHAGIAIRSRGQLCLAARVVPRFDGDRDAARKHAMEEEVDHGAILLSASTDNQRGPLSLSGLDGRSGLTPRRAPRYGTRESPTSPGCPDSQIGHVEASAISGFSYTSNAC